MGAIREIVTVALPSVEHLSQATWDRLVLASAHGTAFHAHGWLRAYETSAPGECRAAHIAALDGDELVGVCPAFVVTRCPRLQDYQTSLVLKPVRFMGPVVIAHSLYAFYGGVVTLRDHNRVTRRLVEALMGLAKDAGASVVAFVNIPEGQAELLAHLEEERFHIGYISSTNRLAIRWQSYTEYMQHWSSHRRTRLARERRVGESRGLHFTTEWEGVDWDHVVDLTNRPFHQHGLRDSQHFTVKYLRALTGPESSCGANLMVARDAAGRPIGYCLLLTHGTTLLPWIMGLDYDAMPEYNQNHAYYHQWIQRAIRDHMIEIDTGRGSYQFKARYGFTQHPLRVAMRGLSPGDDARAAAWVEDIARNAWARFRTKMAKFGRTEVSLHR